MQPASAKGETSVSLGKPNEVPDSNDYHHAALIEYDARLLWTTIRRL